MVHLQLIGRDAADIGALVRSAIEEERIKSFEIARIRGGLRIRHKKFRGEVRFARTEGPVMVTVRSPDRSKEWQLLEAFIGRLTYHFASAIAGINIQLESDEPPPTRRRPKRRARAKRPPPRRRHR